MSPLIIFDENENFLMTLGSPGGKAIISYVFKSLISILYLAIVILKKQLKTQIILKLEVKYLLKTRN